MKMRRIIDGKVYDTATAEEVADIGNSVPQGDFEYDRTSLYRTKKGAWFIAGHGGPRSRWSEQTGQRNWSGGEGLKLVEQDEARELVEQRAPENYAQWFGEPEEG